MLELPDVERMIDGFAAYATGKTISEVLIDDETAVDVAPKDAKAFIGGHVLQAVERHGTFVVVRLRSGKALIFDMGADGEIYLESQTAPPRENSRIRLQFAAGRELRFSSSGKQAEVQLLSEGDSATGILGLDPLSEDFTLETFHRLSRQHPRSTLKGLLMNQEVVAGIGNEYADEICFQSGYRPDLRVADMTEQQLARVHRYLRRVLRRATLHWQAAHADPGWLINYRSPGESCPRCRNRLQSMNLVGRKTYVCPRCQRAA